MDDVQERNNFIGIPSSQSHRRYKKSQKLYTGLSAPSRAELALKLDRGN
jgi:hypothetical protein